MNTAPRWTRTIVALLGLATVVFGVLCFTRSEVLFGVDAYRTLARVPIGLTGASAVGLGLSALMAAHSGDGAWLRAAGLPMLLASLLVPPVVGFNIGAFDQTGTSGLRSLAVVAAFSAFFASPLLAAMLALRRRSPSR